MATTSANAQAPMPRAFLYLLPGLIGFVVIVVIPAIMNAGISLLNWKGVGAPRFAGLLNYQNLFRDDAFWSSLQHTAAFVFAMAA